MTTESRGRAVDRHRTIADTVRNHAANTPDAQAFVFLERGEREAASLTYEQLDRRARIIAQALRERDLSETPVILAYPSGLEFIAALFGCFYAGAVAVPAPLLSSKRMFERVRAIAKDCNTRCVLTLNDLIFQDMDAGSSATNYLATDTIPDADMEPPPPDRLAPESLAILQYTSGSTGVPRGVMLTHANIMSNQRALSSALGTTANDVGVCWVPMYHDMGLIGGLLHSLHVGGFSALLPPLSFLQRPMRWLEAISKYQATISMAPCFAYELCLRNNALPRDQDLDLSSWRIAICGGEPVRSSVVQRFVDKFANAGFRPSSFLPSYGLAEATLLVASPPAGSDMGTRTVWDAPLHQQKTACCGTTWDDQRIAVVDPESLSGLPDGQVGEICVQGTSVAAGYWNKPEETAATFGARLYGDDVSGHWLRTGDLGFVGPEGLFVTGRRKELIVVRGVNHDPYALETVAAESHPALAPGAGGAFSFERDNGEVVVLVHEVERSALKTIDLARITESVAEAVNRNYGLALYDLVLLRPGTLPRTTSGKVQRFACREFYLAGRLASIASIEHPALGRCRPR